MSVNVSHAVYSILSTHNDLAMKALVWLYIVSFKAIRFGAVWFSASQANLR